MAEKNQKDSNPNWSHKNDFPIEEVWNTDKTLSKLIAPRLLAFKALDKHGHPPNFDDMHKWNQAIQKMADAFELMQYAGATHTEDEFREAGRYQGTHARRPQRLSQGRGRGTETSAK